jgi:Tol biopolymer transport system component
VNGRLAAALADRYRIERELGAGGMATVYLADDLKHDRKVAIKVLKPELAAVLGADRFVQEIKTTAQLQHPHILPLHDSGTADGFLFYVMPYIEGETLRDKLDRETQLGTDEAVRITREVADALDYAHRQGIIHRDIKPENILLHDGRPMVADFGIALAVSAAAGGRMTETGTSVGTPHYMSPEQATADKEITARADQYSLASVLYEMLTGEPPHSGASAQAVIMKIITDPARPVSELRKSVPPNVAAAVMKALEKLPADRFESTKAFREALENPGFTVRGIHGAEPSTRGGWRSRLPWMVAAASLLTTTVFAGRMIRMSASTDSRPAWLVDLNVGDSAGFRNGLALSPDGGTVAWGGLETLWVRGAGSTTPVPVAGTDGGCCPAFSPDGQQLAFVRGRELLVLPLGGGSGKVLGTGFLAGDDIAWTTDGYIVGPSDAGGVAGVGGLVRVPATGGAVEPFTSVNTQTGEAGHWSPRALPGGGVLFTILPLERTDSLGLRIGVVGPKGGAHSVLMPGRVATFAAPGHLIVTRGDGTIVAVPFDPATRRLTGAPVPLLSVPQGAATFSWVGYAEVSSTGTLVYVGGAQPWRELVWVDRAGLFAPAEFDSRFASGKAAISADGTVIAFNAFIDSDRPAVEVRDLRSGADSRIEIPGGRVEDASFAGDGRTLVFRALSPAGRGIFSARLGRLDDRTELLSDPDALAPALSPDGRTLYFVRGEATTLEFVAHVLDPRGVPERVLVSGGTGPNWLPRVSPDGRWVAFVETGSSGANLYVRSTDPDRTERWPVASQVGESIAWSPDGAELYFVARDSMMAARTTGAADSMFTVGRAHALFAMRTEYSTGISTERGASFAVAPDGRFLIARQQSGPTGLRLMLVDDWHRLMSGRDR